MAGAPASQSRAELDQALFDDLLDLYHRTGGEVTYIRPSGRVGPYWPTRYLRMIRHYHNGFEPSRIVEAVERMVCKAPTVGFGILEEADRLDLSVEILVVDDLTPYHHLFSAEALEAAHTRVEAYLARQAGRRPAGGASPSAPGVDPA